MRIRVAMSQPTSEIGVEGDLPNYTSMSRTTVHGWAAVGFSIVMLLGSMYVVFGVLGVVGGTKHAPDWVLWVVALLFGLSAFILGVYGVLDVIERRRSKMDVIRHPHDVWRGDYRWSGASNRPGMKSRESGWWVMQGLGVVIVIGFTAISTWVSMTGQGQGIGVGVFLWMMTGFVYLFLLLFGVVFIQRVIGVLKYGSPRMVYERLPIAAGEMVTGSVMCPRGFASLERITITMRYVVERYEQRSTSSGKGSTKIRLSGTATDQWVIEDVQEQLSDRMNADGLAGEIPVAFLLPEDAADTEASKRPARFWDLEVRGEAKGVDFVHRFAVPVYSGDAGSESG